VKEVRLLEGNSGSSMFSVKSVLQTSITDVLNKMGAVPAGFRESTLAKLKQQGILYCL
jgi:hypothetical protein